MAHRYANQRFAAARSEQEVGAEEHANKGKTDELLLPLAANEVVPLAVA